MKKMMIMAMAMVLCFVGVVQAGKQKQMDETAKYEGAVLIMLGAKGLATVDVDQNKTYLLIYMEPSWWKKQTRDMKQSLVNEGIILAQTQKRDVLRGVYVVDRVSRDYLAFGSLTTGEITIYK